MRRLYILSLCAVAGVSGVFAQGRFKTAKSAVPVKASLVKAAAEKTPLWRPVSQVDFMWDGDEAAWMEIGKIDYTYDIKGNTIGELVVMTEMGDTLYERKTRTFDSFGNPTSVIAEVSEDGLVWSNSSKRTYVYDPVVHSYFTERLGYDWSGDDWVENYLCEENVITRNADGNIVEIVKSLPMFGTMTPAYKSVWGYDSATGKADEFTFYTDNGSGWEVDDATTYVNLEWKSTDGQMTESSMWDFLEGANRISKCEILYNGNLDGYFLVDYPEDKPGDYLVRNTYADSTVVGATSRREVIDENGSYRLTESEYFDEDGEPTAEPTYVSVYEVTFDSKGNAVLETITETYEGVTEMISGVKADYDYDDDGNVRSVVVSDFDYEEEEYFPTSKTVYGEYSDILTGIGSVSVAPSATSGAVYNLQGIKVAEDSSELDALPAGLYISGGRKLLVR